MRILQLGKAYPPVNLGGVESTIQLINEGLHKEKIKCDVLGVNYKFESVEEKLHFGSIFRSSLIIKLFSTLLSLSLIFKLNKIKNNYDVIHIHHPDPMSAVALWFSNSSTKVVLHWHSDILKQRFLLKLFNPIQTWLLNRADVIIATSLNYAEGSSVLLPFKNKIKIVPIGLDNSKLCIDPFKVNQILERYKNHKIILSIGRMSYYKGYEYLIDSVRLIKEDCKILIIGGGKLSEKLKASIPSEHLGKIEFLGNLNDLDRNCYLAACDIFVLSSIYKTEAFAIAQVEAMYFGKPIISTEIPGSGVHWVNLNNISGLTIPIKDSKSLAIAINKIVDDSKLYNRLAKGAFNRYQTQFTQELMIRRLICLYKELLNC